MQKNNLWNGFVEGVTNLFAWIAPDDRPSQERLKEMYEKCGLEWHDTAAEALASDWRKVGGDMRAAMNKPEVK